MKNGLLGTLIGGVVFVAVGYFAAFYAGKPLIENAVPEAGVAWKGYFVFAAGLLFVGCGVLILAAPIRSFAVSTLAMAAAAIGIIGQRKARTRSRRKAPPREGMIERSAAPAMHDSADDGFDIPF